jgi:signal transduction histidine kinase
VVTAALKQYFSYFDQQHQQFMRRFWHRSLVSAYSAQTIADLTGYKALPQAYLCGLLMDVGQLCLLADDESAYASVLAAADTDKALVAAERKMFGITHGEIGTMLLDSWRLGNFMADALRYHHEPAIAIVHSHHLVKVINLSSALSEPGAMSDATLNRADQLFGLNEDLITELCKRIARDVERAAESLGIVTDDVDALSVDRQANIRLGQKLSELTQLQTLRHTMRNMDRGAMGGGRHEQVVSAARALYLSFGFEQYLLFTHNTAEQKLEAVLDQDDSAPDFVVDISSPDGTLVGECFRKQQFVHSQSAKFASLSVLDQQLLRYCAEPCLLCLPFNCDGIQGVLVVGATQAVAEQLRQSVSLWQSLINEIVGLLVVPPNAGTTLQAERDAARISEAVHEARNPLSVISNYLEVLRIKLGDNAGSEKEFRILREEIDRIGNILVRLNKPDQSDDSEVVDVNRVVSDLTDIFRESMCVTRDITVELGLDDRMPALMLSKAALKQVMTNLLKNAIEAMPEGGTLTVSSQHQVLFNGKPHVAVTIENTGAAIPEAVMGRLFSPAVSSKGEGHIGLGLSVVKKLMDEMKGQVMCTSQEGCTQFKLLFPIELLVKQPGNGGSN